MKIVIAGGTGQIGEVLSRHFTQKNHQVVVLSRGRKNSAHTVQWDARTKGDWFQEIDGSDVVINLAGRSVNCRYSKNNLQQMLDSRVHSTRIIGQAISESKSPPKVWLQMSTATIYAHRFDSGNDETTGIIGGEEPGVPSYWRTSINIAKAWEKELQDANTPQTRKVALRTAMMMSPDKKGVFDVLVNMTRACLGGAIGGGNQFVSWIHETDFVRAIEYLMETKDFEGPVNLCSPNPIPQREFMKHLQNACGSPIALPATKWMAEIGAFFLRTDTELLLKSRRVIPQRLSQSGFLFQFPDWSAAAVDLVSRHQ